MEPCDRSQLLLTLVCFPSMRYRRTITLVALFVGLSGLGYAAIGAYVRSTSGRSLKQAASYLQRADPARSRGAVRWLLWFEPHHSEALHLTGLSFLQQQKLPEAIENLQRVGENSPAHMDAQLNLAAILLQDRQFDRVESVLQHHLEIYPGSLTATRFLSGLFLTELRQREAVQVLEECLRRSMTDPFPLTDQLTLLRDLSTAEFRPPLAATCRATLLDSLKRYPDQPGVRLALAECERDAGQSSEAEALFREALQQRPQDLRFRLAVCSVLIETDDPQSVAAILAGRQDNSSTSPGVGTQTLEQDDRYWELQSRIAERSGDLALALNHIERAASIQPAQKKYESRKAQLLQRAGRGEEARLAYARSHELARAELDLWHLSQEVGTRSPSAEECERIAQSYEQLGKSLQAGAWRRLVQQIEQAAPETLSPEIGRKR